MACTVYGASSAPKPTLYTLDVVTSWVITALMLIIFLLEISFKAILNVQWVGGAICLGHQYTLSWP